MQAKRQGGPAARWFKQEEGRDPGFRPFIEAGRRRAALAVRVRELREKAGLSQGQLAERAGMHQPGIARMENARGASSTTLEKIAAALGCSLSVDFAPRRRRSVAASRMFAALAMRGKRSPADNFPKRSYLIG
jgi:transcriptional regulator with XRE-family HTH domain